MTPDEAIKWLCMGKHMISGQKAFDIRDVIRAQQARIAELEADRGDWRKCVELIASAADLKTRVGTTIAEKVLGFRARIAELEAVVKKLPVYADTGKPFVPWHDKAWVRSIDGSVHQISNDFFTSQDSWRIYWTKYVNPSGLFYSTREAAEAAKGEA